MGKFSRKIKTFFVLIISTLLLTGCSYTVNISPVSSTGLQIANDFIVIVKNNSDEGKNVTVKLDLLQGDKIVKTIEDSVICAPSKKEMAIVIEDAIDDKKIDGYKIKLDSEKSIYTDYSSSLSIEELKLNTTNKKNISLKLENNGENPMSTIELLLIYYKDNKPISYSWKKAETIKAGSNRTITINKPEENGNILAYDKYNTYYAAYAD